jgi:hypothetical protein
MNKPANTFARIANDWIELFRRGLQIDSNGVKKEWTDSDLKEMASNFDAGDSFPIVVGHPKTNSPAFGWGADVKVEDGAIFAKFDKLDPKFIEWGQRGNIRNRSVKIVKGPKGYKIAHVGFLGAAPPAVEGMASIEFAAEDGQTFEFSWTEGAALSGIARMMRGMRDFFIEKFGLETADRVIPSYEIENAERLATQIQNDDSARSSFTAPHEDTPMPDPTLQAQLDAERARANTAVERAQQLEFNQRLADNRTFVQTLTAGDGKAVRLLPAQALGIAEFLTQLQGLEQSEFTFSADGTEKKQGAYEFAKAFLSAMPVQLKLGPQAGPETAPNEGRSHSFSAPIGDQVDTAGLDLHSRAKAYQADHPNTLWLDCVRAVGG